MKLDRDLVRQILLAVEEQGDSPNRWIDNFAIDGHSHEHVSYHVWLLQGGGYLEYIDLSMGEGDNYVPRCLTIRGHEFLEAVRDEWVWSQTKEAAKSGGAATIDMLRQLALAYLRQKLEKMTGLDLG